MHDRRREAGSLLDPFKDAVAAVRLELKTARDHLGLKVDKTLEAAQRQEGDPQVAAGTLHATSATATEGALAARQGAPPTGDPRKARFRRRHRDP